MTPDISKAAQLEEYLSKEICQHKLGANIKKAVAHFVFLAVIISSSLGLINPKTKWFPNLSPEVLAVIPGIFLLLSNTFKFEEKAKWNKLKQRKLEGIQRKLLFENASVESISSEITAELEKLDGLRVQLNKPAL